MRDPVLSNLSSQVRSLPDLNVILLNIIVYLEESVHASLRQDRMRGLEIEIGMITRDLVT
jgi:hypothetical protein